MRKTVLLSLIIILFASLLIIAQEEFEHQLDTIVVEASRTGSSAINMPFSIDYIDAETLSRSEAGISLSEILYSVPGVTVDNRFNPSLGDRIIIRGIGSRASFGVRGIKILLDNIPLTMPDGQSQLNNIDFGSIGSIEVIRGPSSSLYGNSSGGVINIKTQKMSNLPISFQPKVTLGEFGLKKYEGKLTGNINEYSYLLNISGTTSDGYREHSAVKAYSVNSLFGYHISPTANLKLLLNYYSSPYALNPGSLNRTDAEMYPQMARDFVKQQGGGQKTTQFQSGITFTLATNPHGKLESTLYFISRDLFNPIPGRVIDLYRNAAGIRTHYNLHTTALNAGLNISMGTDIELQYDYRKEYVNNGLPENFYTSNDISEIYNNISLGNRLLDQKEKVVGIGPFIQSQISFSELTFLLGLRFDSYRFSVEDNYFDDNSDDSGKRLMKKFSPTAGINYKINNLTKIFINYSTSFQTPTTVELSNRPDGQGGFNNDLLPEDIKSVEIGFLRYALFNKLNFNASLFFMGITNMLIPYQLAGSEEIFYVNAGKSENRGIELSVEYFPVKNIIMNLSYTRYDFIFKDYVVEYGSEQFQLSGNKIPGVPENKLTATVSYQEPEGLFVIAKLIVEDKYFTNDFNGPPPNSDLPIKDFINKEYFRADLRLGYLFETRFSTAEIFVGINNVFNQRYNSSIVPNAIASRFFEPANKVNWYAGMKLLFPAI